MNKMLKDNKPIIETMINTSALTLTSFAIVSLTNDSSGWIPWIKALILMSFGFSLEFFKYFGRSKKLW